MRIKNVLQLFTIFALIFVGAVLYITSPKDLGAKAETTLTTNWSATEFVNVQTSYFGWDNFVTVGVSKWRNETREGSRLVYEEQWSADVPSTTPNYFELGFSDDNAYIKPPTGYSKDRLYNSWLINGGGITTTARYSFSSVKSSEYIPIGRESREYMTIGNSAKCRKISLNQVNQCLQATGSYGFQMNQVRGGDSSILYSGSMVPIKWTVTGKIY